MRVLAVTAILLCLSACSGQQIGLSLLQLNASTVDFPEHFRQEAARVATKQGANLRKVSVSTPRPMIGQDIFSPRRWYSCLIGVSGPAKADRLPTIVELAERTIDPAANAGVFHVVLFFSGRDAMASVALAHDSPLCRRLEYTPLVD